MDLRPDSIRKYKSYNNMKKLFVALVIFLAVSVNAQWVQMNVPTTANICCFTKIGTNLFAGTRRYSYNQIGGVYLSTNNGYNWSSLGFANKDIYSIAASDSNLFISFESTVCLSTNNGTNWNYVGFNAMVSELAVLGSKLFAGCFSLNSGIYSSTNNGTNWNLSGLNDSPITKLEVSGTNIYAGTQSGIYISTDNGSNWSFLGLTTHNVSSIAVSGQNLFVGSGNGVYLSTNNGTTWSSIGLSIHTYSSLVVSDINLISASYNGIYLTTNNGINWLAFNQGFNYIPNAGPLFIKDEYLFVGDGQSVWRRPLSEITGIQNISTEIPSSYSLSQNYPNPFNPNTVIGFQLSVVSDVSIKIYDVQGREVQTLVNERMNAGTYEVSVDGMGLNSGVYFYQMRVSDFKETRRMLLIK